MAGEFYQGAKQQQIGQGIGALKGPDMSQAQSASDRRTKSIINGLDGLVNLGAGAASQLQAYSAEEQKKATLKGTTEANTGVKSTASYDVFSLDAQQEAYDDVKAEVAVAGLPQFTDEHLANNKNIKKPLDELSPEELKGYMAEARSEYFKVNELNDSPIRNKAEAYANEMSGKQFSINIEKARGVRQAKAQNDITTLVTKRVNAFQGSPSDIDADLEIEVKKYQQSLGDPTGTKTKETIVTGLLNSVMQEKPNLNTLSYLKSEEAKARFGELEGFDKAVEQADRFSTAAQNSLLVKEKAATENKLFGLLNNGGFSSKEEVQAELDQIDDNVYDQQNKFNFMNKAIKHMKLTEGVDNLQGAVKQKQFGVVNSARQELVVAAFERNAFPKNADLDTILNYESDNPNDPILDQQNSFTKWVQDGFNVPNFVKEHLNSPINAGNTNVWDKRLATYQRMSQRLGATGLSKLYNSDTQASLDEYAALTADVTMKPEMRKQALTNFMEGAKQDRVTGLSTNATIRQEIMDDDKGIMKSLQQFAAQGGGDTTMNFDVPPDLQPFTSFSSNSDTSMTGYAVKSLAGNYSVYRRQNPNADTEVALRKAKNDFLNQNYWVEWNSKSTYVPREFGDDFATRGMKYVKDSGIITRLSISESLPPEVIERKITVEPSSDYHSSRKMSVYYDGIEQDERFSFDQFDRNISLLSASERQKIQKQDSDRRNSKEYKDKQEKINRMNKSLRTFGFGMN